MIKTLFEMFLAYSLSQRLQARGGQIIDAMLVTFPKKRNNREEHKKIKVRRMPDRFDQNPDILRENDLDAS